MLELRPTPIDIERVRDRLSRSNHRFTTDVEASLFLRSHGFVPYGDGWIGDEQSIAVLHDLLEEKAD